MTLIDTITAIAKPIIADKNLTLAGIRVNTEKGTVVQVLLENADGSGANVGDCAQVSRELGYAIEVEDAVKQAYTLEVSSPGLNRPLFDMADVTRFVGKNAKVKLFTEVADKKVHTGILGSVEGESFILHTSSGDVTINQEDIKDAKLAPTDQEIQQILKQKKPA